MQHQRIALSQELRMRMSPQMYQTLQMMALPVQELKTRIQEEAEKNPALEIKERNSNISIDNLDNPQFRNSSDDYFENSSDPGFAQSKGDSDSNRMFIEGVLSRPKTLQEYLIEQLLVQPVDDKIISLGKLLIQNLDENGFNIEKPNLFAKGYSKSELAKTVELIRALDPQGTCTNNFRESLAVQARISADAPPHTIEVIERYFELLEKAKYKEIAKNLKISKEDVARILAYIKQLNPFPGKRFSNEMPIYVIPDLMIKIADNELIIKLNEEEIPVAEISPEFQELKKNTKTNRDKEAKKYMTEKIREAEWLINTLSLRSKTLMKTAKAIALFQKQFFLNGPEFLMPLTLKDIAKEVGVHEATISRIANSKYVQTDWGIYQFKYFFSSSVARTGYKKNVSRESVKYIIKEIIETEGKTQSMSDKEISDFLKKSRGIIAARRTVAKYRKELDIASSFDR